MPTFVAHFIFQKQMGRIVAVDYGTKRVGIATTDPLQLIANALGTFSPDGAVEFLRGYLAKEVVDEIVVGKPLNLDGQGAQVAVGAHEFANRLRNAFRIVVEEYDERFTSRMAQQAILASGVNRKTRQDKALVDKISACIILQSYLEYKNNALLRAQQ